ncbi:hypothetical protein [Curtobacterium sp. MCBD17_023]|uniref:hypothetical protein n=1 Tax=Curtobacterium sp. MCBD17_023 TaxID=2175657 RepID=UPI000D9E937A|nr:hypothetical protein [Curtobacterium sp. MCBD17_023]PYY48229.1 hypothetical protein DEI84_09530 [Curtobacterium sp. MCBD17_023]
MTAARPRRSRAVVGLAWLAGVLWGVAIAVTITVIVLFSRLPGPLGADPGRDERVLLITCCAFLTLAIPAAGATVALVVVRHVQFGPAVPTRPGTGQ